MQLCIMNNPRQPNQQEIAAQDAMRRIVRSYFSSSNVSLVWNPETNMYNVGVEWDNNIASRLPLVSFGIPVKQYSPVPAAVLKRGATITYGVPELLLQDGLGIGFPNMILSTGSTIQTVSGRPKFPEVVAEKTTSGGRFTYRVKPPVVKGFCNPQTYYTNPWTYNTPEMYYNCGC